MTRVTWAGSARRDLQRIRIFLEPKDPAAAAAVLSAIEIASRRLDVHPLIGPQIGRGRNRKLSVPEYQYVIIYRIEQQRVIVSRVYHAAENWLAP